MNEKLANYAFYTESSFRRSWQFCPN